MRRAHGQVGTPLSDDRERTVVDAEACNGMLGMELLWRSAKADLAEDLRRWGDASWRPILRGFYEEAVTPNA